MSNRRLLNGLSTLKEEITDKSTGRKCTLCKAWNMILDGYRGKNMSELLSRAEERFEMEEYQYNVLVRLAKALEIIMKEEV